VAADVFVTPDHLNMSIVQGGPFGVKTTVSVRSAGRWWLAKEAQQPPFNFNPREGTGNSTIEITPNWETERLQPGKLSYALTIETGSGPATRVPVEILVVAPRPPPKFSYLAGPNNCKGAPGLPDEAICTVPGEKPPGNFTPPRPGGTYVDPNFGATVKVLAGPVALHGYAAPSALSAHNKYAALVLNDSAFKVINVATGKAVTDMPISPEYSLWDADNDELMYFAEESKIRSFDVSTRKSRTIIDYSKKPYQFPVIYLGSRNDVSKDSWISFWVGEKNLLCTLDLPNLKTYCGPINLNANGVNFQLGKAGTWMAKGIDKPSGKRFVGIGTYPTFLLYSVNLQTNSLDFERSGPEVIDGNGNQNGICEPGEKCIRSDHLDPFEDSEGTQWIMGVPETGPFPCALSLVSFRLNSGSKMHMAEELGGGLRRIMTLFRCGGEDAWVDWHLGCSRSKPYCVVSTTYADFEKQISPAITTPIRRTAHLSEIFTVYDNGKEIRRLAEHRSVPLIGERDRSYWTTPRACISQDASLVLADTNFGEPNQYRVILIETGHK
jgi:hypothetical protein